MFPGLHREHQAHRTLTSEFVLNSDAGVCLCRAHCSIFKTADDYKDTLADEGEDSPAAYLLPSVIGAMYLLVGSTTHDLQAGLSLLMDSEYAGHGTDGNGLLAVYEIMLSAAMTAIVSTSDDSETVVLNAVTILMIADLASVEST